MIKKMVFICDKSYDNDEYDNYFEKYPFELSDFQKYAIESIVLGNHILIICFVMALVCVVYNSY